VLEGEFEEGDTVVVDREEGSHQLSFRAAGSPAGAPAPAGV
jgi:hypothetical protein